MTGLSIKTLSEALDRSRNLMMVAIFARPRRETMIAVETDWNALQWQRRRRQAKKFLNALAAKSERMEALETVLWEAHVSIGASWPNGNTTCWYDKGDYRGLQKAVIAAEKTGKAKRPVGWWMMSAERWK